jgi:anti-sigma-K factor RskA
MTCEQLRDGYDTFALGFDDGPESVEIRDHIRRDCPNCVPGVRDALSFISGFGSLAKSVEPPARLRKRIIAAVDPTVLEAKPRNAFGWSLVWAATSVFLLAVAALLGLQTRQLSQLRRAESARVSEALGILSAPDSQDVSFGTNRNLPPRGRVVINRNRGVVLIASNLPKLEEGKTFEMWLIPKGAQPIAAGTFTAASDGTGIAIQTGTVPEDLGTVAVTVENAGGASAPTTKPIIAAVTS